MILSDRKRPRMLKNLCLLLLLAATALAQDWTIFVNNKPFKGYTSGSYQAFLLEAAPLAAMTSVGLEVDETGGKVRLKGEELPVVVQNGHLFVDARDLATRLGGRYNANKETNSVDIYLVAGKVASSGDAAPSAGILTINPKALLKDGQKHDGRSVQVRGVIQNWTGTHVDPNCSCYLYEKVATDWGWAYYSIDLVGPLLGKFKDGDWVVATGVFRYSGDVHSKIIVKKVDPSSGPKTRL